VIAPVRLAVQDGEVVVSNLHDFADTAQLRFLWTHEVEGVPVESGELEASPVGPHETIRMPAPALTRADAESWLTVRAVLAHDMPWAPAGHEIAFAQRQITPAPTRTPAYGRPDAAPFDRGMLTRLGAVPVRGPFLDLWRAPTDNDRAVFGPSVATPWRAIGLDRLTHRVIDRDDFVLRTRVAAAGTDLGMLASYHWRADGRALVLTVDAEPDGDWPVPLPRLGMRLALPASIAEVEWFGGGPGEAYSDSTQALRIGRFRRRVEDLQTPYAFPQENGNRRLVRWAELSGPDGGVRIEGVPTFELTVRRWTSEDLDAARHPSDLVPRDELYVNIDVAQNGLGTASCGPGVLPQYELRAAPARWTVRLVPLPPRAGSLDGA
jgi:beta-galactosidase